MYESVLYYVVLGMDALILPHRSSYYDDPTLCREGPRALWSEYTIIILALLIEERGFRN